MINNKWYNDIPKEIRDAVWRIKAKIPGLGDFEHDFKADVDVDYDQLESQLEEIASIFSYASSILAEAKTMASIKKLAVNRAKATIVREILEEARKTGERPPRKSDIDDLIEGDKEVMKAIIELIKAERTESKMIGFVQALRMKAEVLRSLAGFKRQELSDS